jgi:3-deoxy-D-manno-octulosonic-acid transferase
MRLLYSAFLYILFPAIVLRMLLRSRKAPAYRHRLAQRLGFFEAVPDTFDKPVIWVHAVSVGETLAAAPLIEDLLLRYPEHQLVVTTTTPTGSERVQALFAGRVFHVYAPWDLPGAVKRFVDRVQPRLLLIMETELWPNMLHYSARAGCAVVLANARMSERSARGYLRFPGLTRSMLDSIDMVACQSEADGERLLGLGLEPQRLEITGSIKFDLELGEDLKERSAQLADHWGTGNRPVLVAASTHSGEDEQILQAFSLLRSSVKDLLLILVPRHPERFQSVQQLCADAGWAVCRRSEGRAPQRDTDVVVGDTMGELVLLLSLADVAIIGGSLVPHGGHNVLEAAAWGVPVITGPHMFNFAEISELLSSAGAMIALEDPLNLGACLSELFADGARRARMGKAGREVVSSNRGAKKRLLALIDQQIQSAQ